MPSDLGKLDKLVVKDTEAKEDATALGGLGAKSKLVGDSNPVMERIKTLKNQLEETRPENFKKLLERRIASMGSAIGVIRVGGTTDAQNLYKKLKIEDAVYACRSALRKGYVKGGGLCLKEIAKDLDNNILTDTLNAPYEQIKASGLDKIGKDVIDPAEAIYYAVEHATKVVANLITVESIVQEEEQRSEYEGLNNIASMIGYYVKTQQIKEGQLKQGEDAQWEDAMGGLNSEEMISLDKD